MIGFVWVRWSPLDQTTVAMVLESHPIMIQYGVHGSYFRFGSQGKCVCVWSVCVCACVRASYERRIKSSEVNQESPGKRFIELPSSFSLTAPVIPFFWTQQHLHPPLSFEHWSLFLAKGGAVAYPLDSQLSLLTYSDHNWEFFPLWLQRAFTHILLMAAIYFKERRSWNSQMQEQNKAGDHSR